MTYNVGAESYAESALFSKQAMKQIDRWVVMRAEREVSAA